MAVNGGRNDIVRIDIERLVSSTKDASMSPKCCIFKTPIILRRINEQAYVPDAFSIGPFHYGDRKLRDTQSIKIKYFKGLISRSHFPEQISRNLIDSVMEVEKEARECYAWPADCVMEVEKGACECYAWPIDYEPNDFVKILVIDGCFIIELLRKEAYPNLREEDDPIFTKFCMKKFLLHDLILLENQVPWMVLTRLFNLTTGPEYRHPLFELAIKYFSSIFSLSPPDIRVTCIEDIKHIPDLLRKWMISFHEEVEGSPLSLETIPSATSLDEAGIKLIMRKSRSILDIKFDKGVLEIPSLLINDTTETAFRNLISFEQCYPKCPARITSYAIFIDRLINRAKDAELLGERKIIENWLSPDDAVQFFNKLYLNTHINKNYYQSLSRGLNSYCERRWPQWRAALVRNYFSTPWAILSTMAAVILLILSFLQTWYTII
ncbi:hypothetical protein ACJW30_01G284200 [Castanea mollissima]